MVMLLLLLKDTLTKNPCDHGRLNLGPQCHESYSLLPIQDSRMEINVGESIIDKWSPSLSHNNFDNC